MRAESLLMAVMAWALESAAQVGFFEVELLVVLRIVILQQASASKRLWIWKRVVLLV